MNRKLRQDRNAFLLLLAVTPIALLMALPIFTSMQTVNMQIAQNNASGAGVTGARAAARSFQQMDRNGNGAIERSEAAALAGLLVHFEQADANRDGRLSRVEYAKALGILDAHR